MITEELKKAIVNSLAESRQLFAGSDAKFAISLGINQAQYNRIKNNDTTKVLADSVWITLARRQNISLNNAKQWKIVKTPVFQFVTAQLEICQDGSINSMLCDLSDIGKTVAAQYYAQTHKNAIYIDCAQAKTKQRIIRQIAQKFGIDNTGKYYDVYDNLVYYIKTLINPSPIIILDEYGDVAPDVRLEIKAMQNGTEHYCSWYAIGAEGLENIMINGIVKKKIGFTESFSRFGMKYGKVVPENSSVKDEFLRDTATMIIKANCDPGTDIGKMLRQSMGESQTLNSNDSRPSLRRIFNKLTTAE